MIGVAGDVLDLAIRPWTFHDDDALSMRIEPQCLIRKPVKFVPPPYQKLKATLQAV